MNVREFLNNNNMNLFHSNSSRNFYSSNDSFSQSLQDFHKRNYSPAPLEVPTSGIPLKYLSKKIPQSTIEEVKCPICYNLIWDIVACNSCGNVFCQFCIEQSIKKTGNFCPECRANPIKLEKSKGFKKLFNNIKIHCHYKNCKKLIDYSDYLNHLEKCEFRLYCCKNAGCTYKDTLMNIKLHSNECQYRIVYCEFCKNPVKKNMLENHIQTECPQNIKCPLCLTSMTRGFYNREHYSANNDNIDCLKGQVEIYKKKYNNALDKIEKNKVEVERQVKQLKIKNKKENDALKNEIKILKENQSKNLNEIGELKQELSEWNSSFKDIYNKLVLNKKEKNINTNNKNDDEKPMYLKTQENENERNSNHIKVKTFHLTNTPKLNNYRNFNFDKKNI